MQKARKSSTTMDLEDRRIARHRPSGLHSSDYARRQGLPMDETVSRSTEAVQARPTNSSRPRRDRYVRGGYLIASLILIAVYPFLPTPGRNTVFLLAAAGAIPATIVGMRR